MYTAFQLSTKYLHYYFTASNGKGHGIHSPLVYNFIKNVLTDKKKYPAAEEIEAQRQILTKNETIIEVEDFGAGSGSIKSNRRAVKAIAKSSLKPKKYAQLLFRMVKYYQPEVLLELGTSLGITTAYLASGNRAAKVFTCEGSKNIADIAKNNFKHLGLQNVTLLQGAFQETLPPLLAAVKKIDFAFIDGNHRKIPTLQYFEQLLAVAENNSILVFDDIHWSEEMEAAWAIILQHPAVTISIDLFFIGIIYLNQDVKVKQHFKIAY